MGDTAIFFTIVVFFITLGAVLPFFQVEYDQTVITQNGTALLGDLETSANTLKSTSTFEVIKSIFKMFLWTFGDIHWLMDALIFVPLRILLAWLVIRWIRGVG